MLINVVEVVLVQRRIEPDDDDNHNDDDDEVDDDICRFQFFFLSVFQYFIQTKLKGIGLKAFLLIESPLPHNTCKICQYYQG